MMIQTYSVCFKLYIRAWQHTGLKSVNHSIIELVQINVNVNVELEPFEALSTFKETIHSNKNAMQSCIDNKAM